MPLFLISALICSLIFGLSRTISIAETPQYSHKNTQFYFSRCKCSIVRVSNGEHNNKKHSIEIGQQFFL